MGLGNKPLVMAHARHLGPVPVSMRRGRLSASRRRRPRRSSHSLSNESCSGFSVIVSARAFQLKPVTGVTPETSFCFQWVTCYVCVTPSCKCYALGSTVTPCKPPTRNTSTPVFGSFLIGCDACYGCYGFFLSGTRIPLPCIVEILPRIAPVSVGPDTHHLGLDAVRLEQPGQVVSG